MIADIVLCDMGKMIERLTIKATRFKMISQTDRKAIRGGA
jgi:hypothetical protein